MSRIKKPSVGDTVIHRCTYNAYAEWAGVVDWLGSDMFAFVTAEGNRRYCHYDEDWKVTAPSGGSCTAEVDDDL